MLATPDAGNLMSLCKPTSFQPGGDGSATTDPWTIWPLMFLIYRLLMPFSLELYNCSVQSFSSSTFGSASPQQVCFCLGSYLSCIALPHLLSYKIITIFSVKLSQGHTAVLYLVPGPEGTEGPPCPCPHPQGSPYPEDSGSNLGLLIGCSGPSRS